MSDEHVIGLISWDFARPKGGMGRSLMWIASVLREGGLSVRIGAPVSDGSDTSLLPVTQRCGGHLLFSLLLPFFLRSWTLRHGVKRLLFPVGPGGVLLWKRSSLPCDVIVYHTYLQQYQCVPRQRWKRVFVPWERRMLKGARRIVCFCEDTARVLQEGYGIAGERISVLPHAVWNDTNPKSQIPNPNIQYSSHSSDTLCICIARLEERKGVRVLVDAWKRVVRDVPDARLAIVGSGAQAGRIDRRIASMKDGSVQLIPRLPQVDLELLVSSAQVALCPSYLEGFGLAAAEAMTAGTTVVASEVDGLRSLIDHERTGLLVPAGDAGALADAIVRLLQDDVLCERLADAALREARMRFDPVAAARAVVDAMG
jgi:glycosyltransferase involved in cell wall biosynthesis